MKLKRARVAGKPATTLESTTKDACIVEADESMRIRMEKAPRRYHEDHIA